MKLTKVEIEGYRSIRSKLSLFVEPNVTVILGPNDHGKTNLLQALTHLNPDNPFAVDADLNWDSEAESSTLPAIAAEFSLNTEEREWLRDKENKYRTIINQRQAEVESIAANMAGEEEEEDAAEDEEEDDEEDEGAGDSERTPLPMVTLAAMPTFLCMSRRGVAGSFVVTGLDDFRSGVSKQFIEYFLPRFELIAPLTQISDSATAEDIKLGKNEFMRGIFYYAGLDPDESAHLFVQSDGTQMRLKKASQQLNKTLRESWSQGKDLTFELSHDSKNGQIHLLLQDQAVANRYVRASRRSSGFTHYFSLKTILHARQRDHDAHSFVLLFDEPGVFLHPSGQFDLLQVLERLSGESQVLYVTHSLFMINKTFPTRHRLLMKDEGGTVLDGKPYVGRWHTVLSSLGLTWTGSILFANHVLLVEGDSDPIYIYSLLQKAAACNKVDIDLNSFACMATSESKNSEVIVRLLLEGRPQPRIGFIFDGDKGGKSRHKYVSQLLVQHEIAAKDLAANTAIEDHLPMIAEVYVPAVAAYCAKMLIVEGKAPRDQKDLETDFAASFEQRDGKQSISEWTELAATQVAKLDQAPSKVGIAREYANRLMDLPNSDFKVDRRTTLLIDWIRDNLSVPKSVASDDRIFGDN